MLSIQNKPGRSGPLTFVAVGHEIVQHGCVVVEEQQDIVYRQATVQAPWPPSDGQASPAADDEWAIEVSPTLLFRFSALTYNSHRIHYDRDYARDVEGYPGLLTHGPLQALAMAEAFVAPDTAGDEMAAWSSGTGWSPRCSTIRA